MARRHTRRRRVVLVLLAVALLALGTTLAAVVTRPHAPPLTAAQRAALAARAAAERLLRKETSEVATAAKRLAVALPSRLGAPAPADPSRLYRRPLGPRLVVSFVPYWLVGSLTPADFADSSEVVYSGLCVAPSGALTTSGTDCTNAWADLHDGTFSSFVEDAHADGDRVALSLTNYTDSAIATLVRSPAASAARLVAGVAPVLREYDLDAVNLDIEGSSASSAKGFVAFVADFAAAYRAAIPGGELSLDTYAASASSAPGFFDVRALAPLVDRLFIEGYQLDDPSRASANAPAASPTLGYSAVQSLLEYEAVAPADKLVFGVAFYGLDFTTASDRPGSAATQPEPVTYPYSAIVEAGHAALWDPKSETPYSVFRKNGAWHQLWFDDPVSVALKVALSAELHTEGVGVWAVGMEGQNVAMVQALDGGSAPKRLPLRR